MILKTSIKVYGPWYNIPFIKWLSSDTPNDNEWEQVTTSGTTSDNALKGMAKVIILADFPFSKKRRTYE